MLKFAASIACAAALALVSNASAQTPPPAPALSPHEADFVVPNFTFRSGERLPQLRIHYTTFGQPRRDAKGHVTNAVLVLHGTGGTGHSLIRPEFSGVLFTPGGLLDADKYFIILPDSLGHGGSSKPSDGLHARFPHYDYDDMVQAEYDLATLGLGIDRLRLIIGTSMGCMHAFVWGETYPDAMDALMPLACQVVPLAGRNRIWRKMAIDAIRADPAWQGGDYTSEPLSGLRTASDLLTIAGSAPLQMQKNFPTRDQADAWLEARTASDLKSMDANDTIYQLDASRNYDPSAGLEKIKAPVMWINSADDFINPPELGIAQAMAPRIPHGRFVLLPITDQTRGHGTHTIAAVWKDYLAELLKESGG